MKVRCIDNKNNSSCLTIDKIYNAKIEGEYCLLTDDRNRMSKYKKARFEIVEENKMKVRCIDNVGYEEKLTNGNTYTLITYDKSNITVCDDNDEYSKFTSWRFENIPAQPAQLGLDVLEVPNTQHTHPSDSNGVKHDSGKLKPALLLDDMPLAIQEVLKVLKFGAEKYSEGNWLKVDNGINRYRNAADRHRLQSPINDIDDESGLLHLAHEATSILMLLELKLRNGK